RDRYSRSCRPLWPISLPSRELRSARVPMVSRWSTRCRASCTMIAAPAWATVPVESAVRHCWRPDCVQSSGCVNNLATWRSSVWGAFGARPTYASICAPVLPWWQSVRPVWPIRDFPNALFASWRKAMAELIVALDHADAPQAVDLLDLLPGGAAVKIGSVLMSAAGPGFVRATVQAGHP